MAKDKFSVKFRGTRGSHPTPDKRFLEYGGNTACVEVNVGGHLIILDAGTGIISVGDELIKNHIASADALFERTPINATILLSHIHQDHIQGLTFFKPSNILTTKLNVFGYSDYDESLEQNLSDLLYGKSFPLSLYDITSDLDIVNITEAEVIVFKKGVDEPILKRIMSIDDLTPRGDEVVISCLKSSSHPQNGVMMYKIAYKDKSIVYATDKECYVGADKKLGLFSRNTDLLIHDSQYTSEDYLSPSNSKQGFGHSTFEMAIESAKLSQAKKLAFFHFDPSYDDEKLKDIETHYKKQFENCFMAKEGEEINIL
ncbi:MAG: MBL fold metallo-hydrolase [Candidatus Gastranaerophilales bacterium]|nr:MBL fold metallo-hydrolase [Candidatus Gastranaerophilales bacterium]